MLWEADLDTAMEELGNMEMEDDILELASSSSIYHFYLKYLNYFFVIFAIVVINQDQDHASRASPFAKPKVVIENWSKFEAEKWSKFKEVDVVGNDLSDNCFFRCSIPIQ